MGLYTSKTSLFFFFFISFFCGLVLLPRCRPFVAETIMKSLGSNLFVTFLINGMTLKTSLLKSMLNCCQNLNHFSKRFIGTFSDVSSIISLRKNGFQLNLFIFEKRND
eukprot:UN00635